MSVTHGTAFRTTVADAVTTALGTTANLKFRLSGTAGSPGTAVATLALANPVGAGASAGVLTFTTPTSDTNATGNASPVATATLETGAGTVIVHCAVAASGSDINLSGGLTVEAGDTVACSALTYEAMP